MALSKATLDAIREAVAEAVAGASSVAAPEPAKAKVASPLVAAPKGKRMHATRAHNLATKVPKRHCAACAIGFVFDKANCPKCGAAL